MAQYRITPTGTSDPAWQRTVSEVAGVRIIGFGRTLTVDADPKALRRLHDALGTSCRIEEAPKVP